MKLRIGVIFGGRSGEHAISIRSAQTVIEQADAEKYQLVPLAITPEGNWLSPADSLDHFNDEAVDHFRKHFGEPSPAVTNDTAESRLSGVPALLAAELIDIAFPVLHGTFGEDGTIQGLLEMADLPYIGCGVLASSCGMDKVVMKTLFREAGLPICEYVWFLRSEFESDRDKVLTLIESKIGFPCFVKPANLGSSVGVSRANDALALHNAIVEAAKYDRKIIVEEGLDMREIECAVMGNDRPAASEPGEYLIRDDTKAFLDYTEKYSGTGNNEFVVPSPISTELTVKIKQLAVDSFKAIDGSGLARVDFFLRKDNGSLLVNEINTMPGLTSASGFPKMWAASGKPFSAVIDELVELGLERYKDKQRNSYFFGES
ncbi:MAG: D-alanine--D-alanine ligase [Acidobacteria bacterium]|nr:D-alanine--D-alanine ligase [Acidobacteriota bacterium]